MGLISSREPLLVKKYRKKFILDQGLEPLDLGPEQFAEYLVKDRAKYAQRIKNADVRLD